ncbi:MAG: hypothetical protein M1541_08535 [Acidobacteria bacterium]|nr:hypothetical protein [Acidobacteriota bacterium]
MMRRRALLAAAGLNVPAMLEMRGAPRAQRGPETRLTAVHTMVEAPEWAPDPGKRWDPKPYIEMCRASGVEIVEQKTKNEHGQALWPFRGRPCAHDRW